MRLPSLRLRSPLFRRRFPTPRLVRDEDGSAAIEFALVALPFLLFVLGLLGMGLYFLATTSLEYGVEAAARKLRTGEAEKGNMSVGDFRKLVCDKAGPYIDCDKVSTIVQHATSWNGITPQACTDSTGKMAGSSGSSGELISKYAGTSSEVVLVTLCYEWDLAENFKFLKLGSKGDGSGPAIIQAATAFKSEPYK
jgi:Flp pilus assembly protein TadG